MKIKSFPEKTEESLSQPAPVENLLYVEEQQQQKQPRERGDSAQADNK